ncbi:MAG: glycoside hydrolase family 2 TIM barrel-domain containing protein [Candidatus Omnitrophota bacterium]
MAANGSFPLSDPGAEDIIDYARYGVFSGTGTKEYNYAVKDQAGLIRASGEGIYPNYSSVLKDPGFKELKKQGRLEGNHWDFINTKDYQANFYKWATANETRGIKLFYAGMALERGAHLIHAIKAYYAIVVQFPQTTGRTYWDTPLYIGQIAIDRINYICMSNPQLGIKLKDASIIVENGYDDNVKNDIFIVNPGKLMKVKPQQIMDPAVDVNKLNIIKTVGADFVKLVQYSNRSWQLFVNGAPYIIKGVDYSPSKIGQSPDNGTLKDWMQVDYNANNKIDGPYDSWVDENKNNIQDANENAVGDFHLLWQMGANTIRFYQRGSNKPLLRDLYKNYGIMVIMGDFLGAYTIGSGATWYEGTNYSNTLHQENMLKSVKEMVDEYKDEPYVLMWLLGNENNYGVANNSKKDPESYYKFVNRAAKYIKELDPHKRPVAVCNGEIIFLDTFAKNCPDVDVFGANSYRGDYGFGHLWKMVKYEADKPAIITEYGCPAYSSVYGPQEIEQLQAKYLKSCWLDMMANYGGYGQGNALGGFVFEFVDEWWKAYEPAKHDVHSQWPGPFPDGKVYEEWFGVSSQGDGNNSPFLRQMRESYYTMKELWREE